MTNLATVDDLAAYIQRDIPAGSAASADFYLRMATNAIVGYLGFDPTYTSETVIVDPIPGKALAEVPGWPVASVTKVEVLDDETRTIWTDITTATVTTNGIMYPIPWLNTSVVWPRLPQSWRLTYTHGYVSIPDAMVTACAVIAGDAFSTEAGIRTETQGGWSATYLDDSGSLSQAGGVALGLAPFKIGKSA